MPHLFSAANLLVNVVIVGHSPSAFDRSGFVPTASAQSPKNRARWMVTPLSCASLTPATDFATESLEPLTVVVPPEQPVRASAAIVGRPSRYPYRRCLVRTSTPCTLVEDVGSLLLS